MNNFELNQQASRIKNLIAATDKFTNYNLELQGHWGKYLCVLVAGFLENAISEIYIKFTAGSSSPPVATYTRKMLTKINNPNAARFVSTAYLFNNEWGKGLEEFFENNPNVKNAIDSIMRNRHQIAHGKTTSISVARIREYLDSSIDAIEFIESQCGL